MASLNTFSLSGRALHDVALFHQRPALHDISLFHNGPDLHNLPIFHQVSATRRHLFLSVAALLYMQRLSIKGERTTSNVIQHSPRKYLGARFCLDPDDALSLQRASFPGVQLGLWGLVLHHLLQIEKRKYHYSREEGSPRLNKEDDEFLPWLEQKAGQVISSTLSVGRSIYGRSVFAVKFIQAGECILQVPYGVQITPDNILSEIGSFFSNGVSNITRLAVVLSIETKRGQDSEWAPYINALPNIDEMHNTIFWSKDELEMIRQSAVYQETLNQQICIKNDFFEVKSVLEHFPHIFSEYTLEDFMHHYALVGSRAWGTSKGLSLIPFADFLNHDGVSEAVLLSDEDKGISEVIADRNYAPGEQILIRYGKFPNATLLLDFGFTLANNIYDQVQIRLDIPVHDPLRLMKLKLLHKHHLPSLTDCSGFNSSGCFFTINILQILKSMKREVKSPRGKGKGIPQSLRAFARVLSTTSLEELKALEIDAAENDGRLARRPLKNKSSEIKSHRMLLSHIIRMIQDYSASIESLGSFHSPPTGIQFSLLRRQMAKDLLTGELRVLKSACSWLVNYCAG